MREGWGQQKAPFPAQHRSAQGTGSAGKPGEAGEQQREQNPAVPAMGGRRGGKCWDTKKTPGGATAKG